MSLTPKQEKFVQGIIQGLSQADAYRAAYDAKNMSENAIYIEASKLMTHPKVSLRIKALRAEITKGNIMTAQERLEWLSKLIGDTEQNTSDRLKAVDIMNKMSGEYVTQVAADVSIYKLEDLI